MTDTEAIVAPHADQLLRTYFDVIHVSYPLLDPSRFNSEPQTRDPLLAVMYNLASPSVKIHSPSFPNSQTLFFKRKSLSHHMTTYAERLSVCQSRDGILVSKP